MLLEILKQFNWVDIVIVFLLLKIGYASVKNGFVVELFKLLGTVFSVYIAFHYFAIFSDLLMRRVPGEQGFPLEFMDFLTCSALLLAIYMLFALARNLFCHLVKMEAVPTLSKWGGLLLGAGRGIIASSLVVFLLFISTINYLSISAKGSYLGKRLFNASVFTYEAVWNGVMSKLSSRDRLNSTVMEIKQEYFRK